MFLPDQTCEHKMGNWFSSDEIHTVTSNGEVVNNISVAGFKSGEKIVLLLTVMLALRTIEVAYFAHAAYRRHMKKRYCVNAEK